MFADEVNVVKHFRHGLPGLKAGQSTRYLISLLLLILTVHKAGCQGTDVNHWETVITAGDIWRYMPGVSEPPANWKDPGFDDSGWAQGAGGIGYGDGDDSTVIDQTVSVYMRIRFNIADTSAIYTAILNVDFDDGFVAYLNGVEIARANIGTPGIPPPFDELAEIPTYEAQLPLGGVPAQFIISPEMLRTCLKSGENSLALQVHNCSATSSDLSSTTFLTLGIRDDFHNYRPVPAWFNDPYQQGSFLPVISVNTHGQTIYSGERVTSELKVINNHAGEMNFFFQEGTDYNGNAGIKIRGQSSQMFPKKSYSLEIRNESGADSSVSLLGMPAESDWVLYALYSDKSLMRNALTYYLGRRMARDWQPRFRFCEVFINGDYSGIYMLIEKIKRGKERVDIAKLKPDEITGDDLTGGYIIKADKLWDLTPEQYFEITPSTHKHITDNYKFTYVYPDLDVIVPQQKEYIKNFLTEADNAIGSSSFSDPATGFRKFVDVNSFVDCQIIQEITNNVDGYRLSTYFYKDKDSNGGKLHAGPLWDFDLGYGNEDYTDFNLQTDTWLYPKYSSDYGGRIHWWYTFMQDSRYRTAFVSRWRELRKGPFDTDSVMAYIDNTIDYLGESVDRNFSRWPVIGTYIWPNYFVGSTYGEEVDWLKSWISARMDWIDNNITAAENTGNHELTTDVLVYPNPASSIINLSFYLSSLIEVRMEIFDLSGKPAYITQFIPAATGYQYFSSDISGVPAGYYILRLTQDSRIIGRKKIIISSRQ